ncbi:MAG: 50S ribosomal protein L21 [Candidatus Peregrinibacteria bacterium]
MFAIVDIAGFQEKVSTGDKIHVPLLKGEEGASVTFDKVFLIVDGDTTTVGKPLVTGASVQATILNHGQDAKIRVFKMRRRKRYRRVHGHRQDFTEIEIGKIIA